MTAQVDLKRLKAGLLDTIHGAERAAQASIGAATAPGRLSSTAIARLR